MAMVAKMRLIYQPHYHKSEDQMGRESQSKKKVEEEKVTNQFKRDKRQDQTKR